jgi:crotonobetainyl-CoA:carnitine CoA-transferase CaiB-like acyl-CoA transferase
MPLSLEGIRVVAFETAVSGPMCSALLSDYGAEVIKIETPNRGDIARHWDTVANGVSGYFVALNRNKKSVELDVRTAEGKRALLGLIREADVFVENHRQESIKRLGLTYADLKKINKRLVYCGITGYGKSGPSADEPAYDLLIQAESGLMSLTGSPDTPAKIGVSLCDLLTGIYSALAISLALRQRDKTGKGCEIEMSMFECATSLLMAAPMYYWYRGVIPKRHGMKHSMIAPAGLYLTKDKKYVALAVERDEDWEKFTVNALRNTKLSRDSRFKTNEERLRNRKELEEILDSAFLQKSRRAWLSLLRSAGVALNDMEDVVKHPQVISRKLVRKVRTEAGTVKFFGNPIRFSDQTQLLNPVPALGLHNREYLKKDRAVHRR